MIEFQRRTRSRGDCTAVRPLYERTRSLVAPMFTHATYNPGAIGAQPPLL